MQLKNTSIVILSQIRELCKQLTDKEYSKSLSLLMNNSIGKHVRHIINFFDLTIQSSENSLLDYSLRIRDNSLETNTEKIIQKIEELIDCINELDVQKKIMLKTSYDLVHNNYFNLSSTIARELVYNIEHAVHHMAILKIALRQNFPHIKTSENFGIAYSTIKYLKECVQ